MRRFFTLIAATTLSLGIATAADHKPRMVINLVVSSMRATDLERYGDNFVDGGIRSLMAEGATLSDVHHNYMLTSTPAGLATIVTGAQPSTHGIVGNQWWSYVDSSNVKLIEDRKQRPVEFSTGTGNHSAHRLVVPTLGDMLLTENSASKQYSLAIDPLSAIVLNGKRGVAFWAEKNQTHWTTSSAYMDYAPSWVKEYNSHDSNNFYTLTRWTPLHDITRYHNSEVAVVEEITGKPTRLLSDIDLSLAKSLYGKMCYTPAGNTMLLKFARSLITLEHLGKDENTDILNICFDASRYIAETYGPESIEYEDMLYRLDKDIADFLTFVYREVGDKENIVVCLTSDHGTSPSYNPVGEEATERFNVRQMEVIVNAFLGARYGSDSYILGFANNALYLNHQLILSKRLSLDVIREEVAVFMLQLRGVASAISCSALRNTSFSEGRNRLIQQSYYATRSGDVIVDLAPCRIIEDDTTRSSSISGYRYATHVPLIIAGGNIKAGRYSDEVDITRLAPTLAHIMGIDAPWASTAKPLSAILE